MHMKNGWKEQIYNPISLKTILHNDTHTYNVNI